MGRSGNSQRQKEENWKKKKRKEKQLFTRPSQFMLSLMPPTSHLYHQYLSLLRAPPPQQPQAAQTTLLPGQKASSSSANQFWSKPVTKITAQIVNDIYEQGIVLRTSQTSFHLILVGNRSYTDFHHTDEKTTSKRMDVTYPMSQSEQMEEKYLIAYLSGFVSELLTIKRCMFSHLA